MPMFQIKNIGSSRLYILPIFLVLVDLAFEKNVSDPLNPVKLWLLGGLAVWSLADLASSGNFVKAMREQRSFQIYLTFMGVFIGFLFVDFLRTPVKSIALFGDSGRNLGFLYYLFLAIIGVYTVTKVSQENVKSIYWTAFSLGAFLGTYGLLQHYRHDFVKWVTPFNPVILFTGNPDFASSLLGLFAVICFAGIFMDFLRIIKFVLGFLVFFDGLIIHFSNALQGVVVLGLGIGIVLFVRLFQVNRKLSFALLGVELVIATAALFGTLNTGPLSKIFYKSSVVDRGYYWSAAWRMFKTHPWFGVGIDRYNDYFLQYRSAKYPLIYGYTQTANNAHNVFLQLFATAGIFVGLIYVFLIVFVTYRAYIAIRTRVGKDQMVVLGVVAAWIAFVAQQTISVDTAAISLWGWVFGSSIVALSFSQGTDKVSNAGGKIPRRGSRRTESLSLFFSMNRILVLSLGIVALAFVILPMNRNGSQTIKFNTTTPPSTEGQKQAYLSTASKVFNLPLLNPNDKEQIAVSVAKSNFFPESVPLLKATIKDNPRNANAHTVLANLYEYLKQYENAIGERNAIRILDPYGADNFLSLTKDYLIIGDEKSAVETRNAIIAMAPGTDVAKQADKVLAQKVTSTKK